jgi:hypothetical protein
MVTQTVLLNGSKYLVLFFFNGVKHMIRLNGFEGSRTYRRVRALMNCSVAIHELDELTVQYTVIPYIKNNLYAFYEYGDFCDRNRSLHSYHIMYGNKHYVNYQDDSLKGLAYRDKHGEFRRFWRIYGDYSYPTTDPIIPKIVIDTYKYLISDEFKRHSQMGIGNILCAYNALSPTLQCAVNPTGDCGTCKEFKSR